MAWAKGNEFWKIAFERGTSGRKRKYENPEDLKNAINEWLTVMNDRTWIKQDFIKSGPEAGKIIELETPAPLTIQSLCLWLGVNIQYFNELEASINRIQDREIANEFSAIITHVKSLISMQKIEGAVAGIYNPMLVARIEGLRDQQDITSNNNTIQGITLSKEDIKRISEDLDDKY